jgi:hypothetical protein
LTGSAGMMTDDHWFEISKILLDKGLLGAIALGAGYYFSRAIERYKAVQVYEQTLAEKRIEAYREVVLILNEGLNSVMALAVVFPMVLSGDEGAGDNYKMLVEKLQGSAIESNSLLTKHFALLSGEAKLAIVSHEDDISAFLGALNDFSRYKDISRVLEEMKERCKASMGIVLNVSEAAVQTNPFKKGGEWSGFKK